MSLTVERDHLLRALEAASRITPTKSPIPIAAHLLLAAGNGEGAHAMGSNLDCEVRADITRAEWEGAFAVALPAKQLVDLVRGMPAGSVIRLTPQGADVTVQCGRSRYKMPSLLAEDFPRLTAPDDATRLIIAGAELAEAMAAVAHAQADDKDWQNAGTRLSLCGGDLRVDAYCRRMYTRRTAPLVEDAEGSASAIVPREVAPSLIKIAADSASITLHLAANLIRVEGNGVTLTTKVVEAQWPDFDGQFPREPWHVITVERAPLAAALDRLSGVLVAKEASSRAVAIDFTASETLSLSVRDSIGGDGAEEVAASVATDGEREGAQAFKVYPRQVLDLLKATKANSVAIAIFDPAKPWRMTPAGAAPDDLSEIAFTSHIA
ncbi:DNA polymerase III beta subunit [Hyphomicrobiales bacterium]|nr:DNA polymerase III beta subunit [Hyphomicrobiales bacterium]CAH1667885.1 DNA polymerase III beta subunit [Hyphomicrobiales bacterium]